MLNDPPDAQRSKTMIKLTRLNGEEFLLNAELLRYVEARPDTFITLTTGDRVVVRESMDEVLLRSVEYQRSKHLIPPPGPPSRPPSAPPSRLTGRCGATKGERSKVTAISTCGNHFS